MLRRTHEGMFVRSGWIRQPDPDEAVTERTARAPGRWSTERFASRREIADLRRVPSLLLGQIRRVFSLVAPRAARNCAISLGPANRSVLSCLRSPVDYGAVMRGLVVPSWQPLQAPDDWELMGICFSPLASRTRMSAPARLRPDPS